MEGRINREQAIERVRGRLERSPNEWREYELVVLEDEVLERSFGWVIPYHHSEFLKTHRFDFDYVLFGDNHFIVDRHDGTIHHTGFVPSAWNLSIPRFFEYCLENYQLECSIQHGTTRWTRGVARVRRQWRRFRPARPPRAIRRRFLTRAELQKLFGE